MDFPHGLWAFLLPLVVGAGLIGLAVWVFRSGRVHRHNVLFAGLFLLSGLKSLSEALGGGSESGLTSVADQFHAQAPLFPAGIDWLLVSHLCGILYVPLLFWFILSFPRPVGWLVRHPWLATTFLAPSLALGAVILAVEFGAFHGSPPTLLAFELYTLATRTFNALATVLTVVVLVRLALLRARAKEPIERSQAGIMLVGFLPSFLFGWALTVLGLLRTAALPSVLELSILFFFSPILELLAAAIVAYAILKYRFLGVERKAKFGLKSLVMGSLLAVTFVVTGYVENIVFQGQVFAFAGPYGSFILAGIAGAVVFKPVEMLGQRVSTRMFPQAVNPSPDYQHQRTHEIYRAQALYVLRDAQVTDREWQFLRNLRDQLGLGEAEARRIEEEVERSLKVDDPRLGQTPIGSGRAPAALPPSAASAAPDEVVVRRASPLPGQPPAARPPAAKPAAQSAVKPASKPASKPSNSKR